MPFPCGGHDEEMLSVDERIPIVVDDVSVYDFKLPKKTDVNAIDIDTIDAVFLKWAKTGPKALQAQRTESLALYGSTSALVQRYSRSLEGGARATLTINELQDVIEMLSVVARDGRVSR